jgi:hypothetical protein
VLGMDVEKVDQIVSGIEGATQTTLPQLLVAA